MSQLKFLDLFVKNQLSRVSFPSSERENVARFIKAYYEIRYNISDSGYIPDFDKYNLAQKTEVIANYRGANLSEIEAWEASSIEDEFSKLISSEVHELEEDIGSFS